MKELVLDATTENLPKVIDFVNAELESYNAGMKTQMQVEVSVEEIFVNIAHYAYESNKGQAAIQVDIEDEVPTIHITFKDSGIPYNPLEKEDPDITASAEKRQIGGLGIYMVKNIMDDVKYEYTDGQNILTLSKRLS